MSYSKVCVCVCGVGVTFLFESRTYYHYELNDLYRDSKCLEASASGRDNVSQGGVQTPGLAQIRAHGNAPWIPPLVISHGSISTWTPFQSLRFPFGNLEINFERTERPRGRINCRLHAHVDKTSHDVSPHSWVSL